jgi:peptidyl-prolyl cis-trans isomerase D
MLSLLRRGGPAQFAMGAVVVVIILAFALEFRGQGGRGGAVNIECAVKVQGRCVDEKEFQAAVGLATMQGISASQQKALALNQQMLDGLVERELLLIEAERLGLAVSDTEVMDEIIAGRARMSLPVGKLQMLGQSLRIGGEMVVGLPVKDRKTDQFDPKLYERVVRYTTNRGTNEFKAMQARELLAARMRDLVRARVRVSESEAFLAYRQTKEKVVVRSVQLRRDWFAKWAVDQSDAAVDAWAKENASQVDEAWKGAEKSWTKGCARVREIVVAFDGATDEQKVELRQRIDEAAARIAKGTPFDVEARVTGTSGASIIGGDVGCLSEAHGPVWKDLQAAAEKLTPGKPSAVIETTQGFHLIQLVEKVGEAALVKSGRRYVAKGLAVRFRADELAKKFGAELIEKTKGGQKLEDAATELTARHLLPVKAPPLAAPLPAGAPKPEPPGLASSERPRVEVSAPVTQGQSPIANSQAGENVGVKAFALDKPDAVHGDVIATNDGFAVMQLKEKTAFSKADFDKDPDKPKVMAQVAGLKQLDALVRYMEQLRSAAKPKIETSARLAEQAKGRGEDE